MVELASSDSAPSEIRDLSCIGNAVNAGPPSLVDNVRYRPSISCLNVRDTPAAPSGDRGSSSLTVGHARQSNCAPRGGPPGQGAGKVPCPQLASSKQLRRRRSDQMRWLRDSCDALSYELHPIEIVEADQRHVSFFGVVASAAQAAPTRAAHRHQAERLAAAGNFRDAMIQTSAARL